MKVYVIKTSILNNKVHYFLNIRIVRLDIIKVFYSPTDAQVNFLKYVFLIAFPRQE